MGLTDTIANLYLQKGAAQAQGQERVGQLYGSLISNLGQLPGQIQQQEQQRQAAQQEQQIRGLQITQAQREMAAQDALGKAMSSAVNPDGSFNTDLLQKSVLANPATAAQWPKISEGLTAAQEKSAQVRELADKHDAAERDHVSALANAADAVSDPTEKAGVLLAGLAQGAKAGTIDPAHATSIVGQLLGDDGQPDPQKVTAVLGQMKQLSAADVEKRAQAASAMALAGKREEPPPPTRAGLAVKAAQGDTNAQAALDKLATASAVPNVGSFDDYVVRKYGPKPTPEQVIQARKDYGQADDRAAGAATIVVQTIDENGKPVTRIVPKVAGASYPKAPSGTTENRLASAEAVTQTGNEITAKLADPKYAGVVGPLMGRYNSVRDWVGNPPPELAELAGMVESYALANMGVHGMRSAQGAEQIKKLLDAKHTPQSLAAAIKGLQRFSENFMQDQGRKLPEVSAPTTTPAPTGGAPTYQDYLKSRGQR